MYENSEADGNIDKAAVSVSPDGGTESRCGTAFPLLTLHLVTAKMNK